MGHKNKGDDVKFEKGVHRDVNERYFSAEKIIDR